MHLKKKVFLRLVGLFTLLIAGCRSADLVPLSDTPDPMILSRSACQKANSMWRDKIVPSRYEQLPPLTSPGFIDLLRLLTSSYSVKALTSEGDELAQGRVKLIHAFGVEARFRLDITADAASDFTGIFRNGAECVIGRFSLASKPTSDKSIPALALKFFIAGDRPSVNLLLMNSIDGQIGHNYFGETFSNIIPPATSIPTRILASAFERSAAMFGAKDTNPGRLTLEHLSSTQSDGQRIYAPVTPYQLLFKPTASVQTLMRDARAEDDFRVSLARLSAGQAIYDVFALDKDSAPEGARLLGQLVLTETPISSRYGDEKLYFQHNMER